VKVRLLLAYDGTDYHGFAVQPGVRTVGGALVAALERYLRHTVDITCAGRTDSGVHAWGQVVTFAARADVDPAGMQRALNRTLRPAIVVREAALVDDRFDARRSATGRRYRYTIRNDPLPDPFTSGLSWHVAAPLTWRPCAWPVILSTASTTSPAFAGAPRSPMHPWSGSCATPAGWNWATG